MRYRFLPAMEQPATTADFLVLLFVLYCLPACLLPAAFPGYRFLFSYHVSFSYVSALPADLNYCDFSHLLCCTFPGPRFLAIFLPFTCLIPTRYLRFCSPFLFLRHFLSLISLPLDFYHCFCGLYRLDFCSAFLPIHYRFRTGAFFSAIYAVRPFYGAFACLQCIPAALMDIDILLMLYRLRRFLCFTAPCACLYWILGSLHLTSRLSGFVWVSAVFCRSAPFCTACRRFTCCCYLDSL